MRNWTVKLIKMRNFKYHNINTYYRSRLDKLKLAQEAPNAILDNGRDPKKGGPVDPEDENVKKTRTLFERLR